MDSGYTDTHTLPKTTNMKRLNSSSEYEDDSNEIDFKYNAEYDKEDKKKRPLTIEVFKALVLNNNITLVTENTLDKQLRSLSGIKDIEYSHKLMNTNDTCYLEYCITNIFLLTTSLVK